MLCENYGIVVLMYIASKFIDILQIIVPILEIIGLGINLVKAVTDPEDKKVLSRIKNCIIALIMVFIIPVLVNTTMSLVTSGYSIEGCFEIARNHENILDPSTYTDMPNDSKRPGSILTNPDDYDDGVDPNYEEGGSDGEEAPATNPDVNSSQLLTVAEKLWKQVYNGGFTYSSSSSKKIPITGNKIDCSAYVTWILYEAGYSQFGGKQLKTKDFMLYDWTKLGATVINVKAGENIINKLQPGDILVRTPVSSSGKPGYGHVNITDYVKNNKVYSYDCGSTNNWKKSGGKAVDKTYFAKDSRPGKIIRFN